MEIFIGLDDTDDLDSRGTGFLARQLGAGLHQAGLAQVEGVTRHQLLVSPRIPYTSHNSAACLSARLGGVDRERVGAYCRQFLLAHSAQGADAGLCVAAREEVDGEVLAFGVRAKKEVLEEGEALDLAGRCGLLLEGLTGTRLGVIGALAGVGLRSGGEDGRFLWLPGLRELSGVHCAAKLRDQLSLGAIRTLGGEEVPPSGLVEVGPWPRPLLRGGEAVLFVEEVRGDERCQWRVLDKEPLKNLSA
jgi:hypothetical protein